ncbi:conserved oligomeric golgi complex component 7 [Holotrichia oblita]|uniref:Conserved oligomeric golgi complex component 7 n=1 Tax=Holotrichia oblita TaxID=644536 RepID=A0ACB9SSC2_HOLOL|nr:conserved oligomeric golgi complex component 7 [Holotrichia oblita]
MDISAFSDDNFDTKIWVNEILKSPEGQEKKETFTMSLVMKLQLYVQQINAALEEASQEVFISLPKIIRDTQSLQEEGKALQEKMGWVKDQITDIEKDTGDSMKIIENLDYIKTKLELAKQGLHESDNWTVLVNELEEMFDSKNIESICAKLVSMQQSLKLLVNIHDYEDRKLQLEGLKNRLEAIVSPLIVQAFTTNNIEQSIFYAKIFSSIDRLSQLSKYYHKCQKDILVKKWRNQLEIEQDEAITQVIHNYFDVLLSNWHTQCKWLNQVFPNNSANKSLIDIYTDAIASFDPSLSECIDAALKQQTDKLGYIHEVKNIIKQFSNNLLNTISTSAFGHLQKENYLPFLQIIYSPLVPYVSNYVVYEQVNLSQKLAHIKCVKEELSDTIQALGLTIPSVMDLAREAKRRCEEITENCGYCGFLKALRTFLQNYADHYRVALRQIDRGRKHNEDWTTFQLCLCLLQNTGEVLINLQALEKDLTLTVLDFNKYGNTTDFKYLLLNAAERKEYESLIKCVSEGTKLSLLDHGITEFNKLCVDIHNITYQVIFSPISIQLSTVASSKTWLQFTDSTYMADLPDYSFSPQEYITQIGQYLMTLPQHLEPFLFRDNPSLNCALKAVDSEYASATDVEGALADVFLNIVSRGTCQTYSEQILSIYELSAAASRQLAHDIGYLGNVLEDLGLTLTDTLEQLIILLKLPADQYQTQSGGCSARYVAAIRQMRNIQSAG